MDNQPLVPQEIQDYLDGKIELPPLPITGNKLINDQMQNQGGKNDN